MYRKYGMTFNGIKKDYIVTLRGKKRPPWSPLRRNLVEVPGKVGAYNESTDVLPRILEIPLVIDTKSLKDLQKVKEEVAAWLVTDEPKELIFDDEPDRVYYAMVESEFDVEEIVRVGGGILKFICPDPYKYGAETHYKPGPGEVDLHNAIAVQVGGTEKTPPVIDLTLKGQTTYLDIISGEDYMRLGRTVNEGEYAAPRETQVMYDGMSTLTGWTARNGFDLDWTTNNSAGTMKIVDGEMRINNASTGTGWHGPAVIKSLGQTLTDFDMILNVRMMNPKQGNMGRIEMYLLDDLFKVAGKLSIRHRTMSRDGNHIELRAGDVHDGHNLVDERGDNWNSWLNFKGRLQLSRVGNEWNAYVAKYTDKNEHYARRNVKWIDLENGQTRKVSHILIHMGQYGTNPITDMGVNAFRLNKINSLSGQEIPYIGEAGDEFKFDMGRDLILKNDAPFMKKDFGSRFFDFKPGSNVLVFDPPDVIDKIGMSWRERYK